jgi:hypothetical protein
MTRMWLLQVLDWHLSGGTEENHKTSVPCKLNTFRKRVKKVVTNKWIRWGLSVNTCIYCVLFVWLLYDSMYFIILGTYCIVLGMYYCMFIVLGTYYCNLRFSILCCLRFIVLCLLFIVLCTHYFMFAFYCIVLYYCIVLLYRFGLY